MEEAKSESFKLGLKALLDKHPELRPYAPMARQLTELIETYGDALRSKEKYLRDGGDHEMILAHYTSVCRELEEHLRSSLFSDTPSSASSGGGSINFQPRADGRDRTVTDIGDNATDRQTGEGYQT